MTPADKQAALAAIEREPERYEVIRHLPEDLRALLEPEERLRRYANIAAVLIGEAGDRTRRMLEPEHWVCDDCGRVCPVDATGCFNPYTGDDDCDGHPKPPDLTAARLAISLILNAAVSAVQTLERQRAEASGAAFDALRRLEAHDYEEHQRLDKQDAATGGRTLAEVLDSERALCEEVARLRCQLVGEARV